MPLARQSASKAASGSPAKVSGPALGQAGAVAQGVLHRLHLVVERLDLGEGVDAHGAEEVVGAAARQLGAGVAAGEHAGEDVDHDARGRSPSRRRSAVSQPRGRMPPMPSDS